MLKDYNYQYWKAFKCFPHLHDISFQSVFFYCIMQKSYEGWIYLLSLYTNAYAIALY